MGLKKITSIFLAAVLTISSLTIGVSAEDTEVFKVEVEAETTTSTVSALPIIYNQGEEITVKLSASQNPGITSLKLYIDYDENLLEVVDGKFKTLNLFTANDEITQKTSKNGDGYFIFYSDNYPNISTNIGTFAEITFMVKQTCSEQTTVTVTTYQNSAGNCQVQSVSGLKPVHFESQSESFAIHNIDPALGVVTKPTCTENGYTTYVCKDCEKSVVGNIVDATGHTAAEAVTENRVEPNCTTDGSYETVVYCKTEGCKAELSREKVTIPATGHDLVQHEGKDATHSESGWHPYETCTKCDYTSYEEIPVIPYITGDVNGDEEVTDADAIYLLYATFNPEKYPLNQTADYNKDGEVTDADAIYLLYATFNPEKYPLV